MDGSLCRATVRFISAGVAFGSHSGVTGICGVHGRSCVLLHSLLKGSCILPVGKRWLGGQERGLSFPVCPLPAVEAAVPGTRFRRPSGVMSASVSSVLRARSAGAPPEGWAKGQAVLQAGEGTSKGPEAEAPGAFGSRGGESRAAGLSKAVAAVRHVAAYP